MKSQKAIQFEIVHLNEQGYHLRMSAYVNGKLVSLILDSGASQTAFDISYVKDFHSDLDVNLAEQISSGLGTNTMESFECLFESFVIGDLKLNNYKAALLDLSHVNHAYYKLDIDPIHGVLGNDILLKHDALIDYKNKQIWLTV